MPEPTPQKRGREEAGACHAERTMLITCPSCSARYELDAATIGPNGRKVRCASCKTKWLALAEEPSAALPAVPEEEPISAAQNDVDALFNDPIPADPAPMAVEQEPAHPSVPAALPPAEAKAPRKVKWTKEKTAKSSATARSPKRPAPAWVAPAAALGALVLVGAGLLTQRQAVVAMLPGTASAYALLGLKVNLRGIEIDQIVGRIVDDGDTRLLVVDGALTNITDQRVDIPRLRFAVRSATAQELYAWTAPADRSTLEAGEVHRFRRRLASPPAAAHDVLVRFVTRADMMAGLR